MFKKSFFVILFFALSAAGACAAGFEPGSLIRAVEKGGQQIEGTILKYENASEISLLDRSGHYFKLPLKDVKRISPVPGQTVMTGGGSKLQVLSFELISGQTVSAGLSTHSVVKIDMGVKGQRTLWITDYNKYQYVEVRPRISQAPGDGMMKVKLINGQIISVPVKKADVQSIIFE